jgi:phosphatidylserine decarboxylase
MTSLDKPDLGTTTVRWRFPSVHPDGRKFVLIAAAITLLFAFLAWETIAWPMAGITLWVAAFFRDPIRTTPRGPGLVVAPADGLITMIATVPPPREMAGPDGLGDRPMTRVSIFMSVFDVHINRTAIAGTIRRVVYISGKFLNADLDKASEENERQHILVEGHDGTRIGFTQIAGLVARRIIPFVKPGYRGLRAARGADPVREPGGRVSSRRNLAEGGARPADGGGRDGDREDRRGRARRGHGTVMRDMKSNLPVMPNSFQHPPLQGPGHDLWHGGLRSKFGVTVFAGSDSVRSGR